MRALHVIPSVSPARGGPSFVVRSIAKGLTSLGVFVDVATTDDDGPGRMHLPSGRKVLEDGVPYWFFPRLIRFYTMAPHISPWLDHHVREYDIVHIHAVYSYCCTVAARAAYRSHIPYVLQPHGILSRWGMTTRRPILKRLSFASIERRVLERAACVVYTTQQEREETERLGIHGRSAVVPNPLEIQHTLPVETSELFHRFPQLRGRLVYLFMSRLDPKKGLDILLPAFAQVRTQLPNSVLLIAGNGEPNFEHSFKTLARNLRIEDAVVWAGFLTGVDKAAAFAAADVFVLPSYSENFAIAVAEAMAAGLPVIITDQVAIHEWVEPAHAGLVIPLDRQRLVEAMVALARDHALRQNMGRRGRELALKEFAQAPVCERIRNLYCQILQSAPPA